MKQSNFITRLISVIFALFIVTYMGYQVWRTLYKPVQTVSAVYIETEKTIALAVRLAQHTLSQPGAVVPLGSKDEFMGGIR